jgi:hypothetical protein
MKIEIEIPDWCDERHIYIMAGTELAAYRLAGSDLFHIKSERCANCGWCCGEHPQLIVPGQKKGCFFLNRIGTVTACSLGPYRPFACCWADPVLTKHPDALSHCSIRYK